MVVQGGRGEEECPIFYTNLGDLKFLKACVDLKIESHDLTLDASHMT